MVPTNHSQAKLFDKKFVALTLRDARRCDKCKREFDIKYKFSTADTKPHSSRPVLLNCGHNICENCIYINRHNLTCAVCSIPIEFEHTRWLKKSYDLNFCLLGQLINSKSFLTSEATAGTHLLNGMLAQESFVQKCSECEQATAVGICMHCKVDFCKRCFSSVHQNSKVLKKHRLSEFEMQTLQLNLPQEKYCKTHRRLCDKFCADCQNIFCSNCITNSHSTHFCTSLIAENANHKDKIMCLLETIKPTREIIRKSQKEARATEKRLEDLASNVVLDITNFFLDLHNHLQLEERKVLDNFKKTARASQKAIHEALSKLTESQTTLNNIRSAFDGYIHKPPNEFHIYSVIELATKQLENIPCQIQITENETNPFMFKKLKDVRSDITNSYKVTAQDPKINIRITPMYGDEEAAFEISSDRMFSPEPMSQTQTESANNYRPSMSISSSCTTAAGKSKRSGKITNIESPSHFYIQDEETMGMLKQHLKDIDCKDDLVESIVIEEMYMVYHVSDNTWLRGIPKNEVKKKKRTKTDEKKYKVFLLDYGIYEDISPKWFRKIKDELNSIPAGAVACKLLDIAPNEEEWSPQAREVMEEIIQNKPVKICIQDPTKTPWNVDVFTSIAGESVSIREALLYTGLGINTASNILHKNKNMSFLKISRIKERLSKPVLHSGEIFRVKITHVDNPHQFFAIKFAQLPDLNKLEAEMELEYTENPTDIIYLAQLQMCSALFFEEKWYRGCIEDTSDPNNILVRLVDDGRTVSVNWRRLHVLKECFTKQQELSIECSLADIQPLQENNYEWTDSAIAEFSRMTKNPHIQLTISSSSQFRYQVVLNALKKQLDINIGTRLVQFKHALSTGECSAARESVYSSQTHIDQLVLPEEQTKERPTDPAIRMLKRTPIQVIHIENPGEFYIHLIEHMPGIVKFQDELQFSQKKRLESETSANDVDWKVNDHCLVLTTIKETAGKQWYRGVIMEIYSNSIMNSYVVFLRDKGLTIRGVEKKHLTKIDDLFDRICSAAILCHLACVHPTGGMKNWSNSSIDGFTHSIGTFESLGATIQGSVKDSSIPVVLWGMVTENNDPLAPCITKYVNINKGLVCAGLAHLMEKIDITRQQDTFVQAEIEEGHQTLQDWYDNFKKTLDEFEPCFDDTNIVEDEDKCGVESFDLECPTADYEPTSEWLPAEPIEKFTFTGYPTYVDDEATVYLHDADKHSLLAKIRTKINNEFELRPSSKNLLQDKWNIGQPCLARYHLDKALYRATIQRRLPNDKYEVRFIDYGNVEVCETNDLHRQIAFANIPIQAVRFQIDGIKPKAGQASFSTEVLDLIHGLIVDKLCAIRIPSGEENKEIKKCSIRVEQSDVATYLIHNNFVCPTFGKHKKASGRVVERVKNQLPPYPSDVPELFTDPACKENNDSEDELKEFIKSQIYDPTDGSPNESPNYEENVAMFNPNEYKQMFEKLQSEKFFKSVTDVDCETSPTEEPADNNDDDNDEDVVELDFSFKTNYWNNDEPVNRAPPSPISEPESNFYNFDPMDTSSLLSNFSGIEIFNTPQLPSSVKSFHCEIAYVRSPTVLHVFPCLLELEFRQIELAQRIQLKAKRATNLTTYEPKTPCLARYSKDKFWYRAIIRSHNAAIKEVKVFYVDFLNTEWLSEEDVRKSSKDLLQWPLRTFEMKLYGVKANPKMREKDVKAAVKKCFNDPIVLHAKIVREVGKIQEICLYKSITMDESLIDDLIEQNYLIRV